MAKPIPYDEDDAPEDDGRDMRKIVLYDDEALKLMQGWTGGQSDPLYAISSTGGWNYAWVFSDAISNIDRDLSRVKKLGRNKFQLGQGTFSKAEIDELRYIRDALQMTLDDPESVMVEEGRGGHVRHVADFNTLDDLIEHERTQNGATHVFRSRDSLRIYYPNNDKLNPYKEGIAWSEQGYWHAQASSERVSVAHPAGGSERIAPPRSRGRHVRDYEAVDNHDRHIAGPFKSYGDARQAAGTAGVVKFVPSRGKRASEMRNPSRSAHTPTPVRRR